MNTSLRIVFFTVAFLAIFQEVNGEIIKEEMNEYPNIFEFGLPAVKPQEVRMFEKEERSDSSHGKFTYTDIFGKVIQVFYTADESGFQPHHKI
ncbi:hypothetical protein GCK72_001669 [Caenorhabditis remanei]|nr:hypothetical protein GCK72_001669 [Caenorhabditis remanei]KAF1769852.1 hypothetical protein GCK72_001669 [Caenorhabditis remanei]